MTKETKINLSITAFGVLLLATCNPLLMMCGALSVLVIPIQAWSNWVDGPMDKTK